ncbi:MAG: hypothetical protein AAFV45_13055 [Pseudomonadota bacterium]
MRNNTSILRSGLLALAAIGFSVNVALAADTAPQTGAAGPKSQPAEAAKPDVDTLLKARYAAVDGRFEECAKLADQARRTPNAIWRAHNVFATCEVFAADAVKDEIGPDAYIKRIQSAIDAFQFLLQTPGVLVAEDRRRSIRFMIEELDKRVANAKP